MLSFRYIAASNIIEIDCNRAGAAVLSTTIAKLVAARASHAHLRVPVNLAAQTPWGEAAVAEVVISYAEGD